MAPLTVVTGGSRGIGAAICARLAADGHDVVIGYRSDSDAADAVAVRVRETGRRALAVQVETSDASSIDAFFDAADGFATDGGGAITGFVNNAAISGPVGRLVDADIDELRHALDVNLLGCLLCARRAIRSLSTGGAIVNISSTAAATGSPGVTWTEFHHDPERPAKLASSIPFGRSGQPEEIASAVAWLLSSDASYVSGAVLRVAGGM
jgi:NAD(P)-dependent dehydrogenase (short-subunit alcohol dehydrogenase family)